jgi:hypothetical protein
VAFPPRTCEIQFDEKWAFVGKKPKNCDPLDPADDPKGDYWDPGAFDPLCGAPHNGSMMMSDPLWISSEANRPGLPSAAGYVARRSWTQLLRDQRLECFQRADLRELAASGGRR